jgi:hypothetical protein
MPQAIEATDADGRWAIYVPLTCGGKIVVPRPEYRDDKRKNDKETAPVTYPARARTISRRR